MPYPPKKKVIPSNHVKDIIKPSQVPPKKAELPRYRSFGRIHSDPIKEWKTVMAALVNTLQKTQSVPIAVKSTGKVNVKTGMPLDAPLTSLIPPSELPQFIPLLAYLSKRRIYTLRDYYTNYQFLKNDPLLKPANLKKVGITTTIPMLDSKLSAHIGYDSSKMANQYVSSVTKTSLMDISKIIKKFEDVQAGLKVVDTLPLNGKNISILAGYKSTSSGLTPINLPTLLVDRKQLENAITNNKFTEDKFDKIMREYDKLMYTPIVSIFPDMEDKDRIKLERANITSLADLLKRTDRGYGLNPFAISALRVATEHIPDGDKRFHWLSRFLENYLTLDNTYNRYFSTSSQLRNGLPLGHIYLRRPVNGYVGDFNVFARVTENGGTILDFVGKDKKGHNITFSATLGALQNAINTQTYRDVQEVSKLFSNRAPKDKWRTR